MALAPTNGLVLRVREEGAATIIAVEGEIDAASASALHEAITAALASGVTHLAVEMQHVSFIDSAGLGALISGYKRAERDGGTLRVESPSESVVKLLRITGQLGRFGIEES